MVRVRTGMIGLALLLASACNPGSGAPSRVPIEGLITSIDGSRMTVQTEEGAYTFEIADRTVPVEHLQEHLDRGLPVRVTWSEEDGLRATRIEDA